MEAERKVGAVQLSARLRGVSPPVTRRLLITEQASLAQLHATCKSLLDGATSICIPFRFAAGNLATQPERSSWRSPAAVSIFRWRCLLSRSMKLSDTSTICSSLGRLTAGSNPGL
jgi:hypothetical protein